MMQQTCDSPLTCLAHGLAWPYELCFIENTSSTNCQRCGLTGVPATLSGGQRVCAGWLRSAPARPAATLDVDAQAPMDPQAARHPAGAWLRRLQRLGLDVAFVQSTITLARSEAPSDVGATAVRLRFSDGTSAVLCRPIDAELAKQFDSHEFKTWTPEICFDDEVIHWKELELVEPSDVQIDGEEHGALAGGSISSLCVQPWTELRSVKVAALRAHGSTPSRVDDSATSGDTKGRETPGEIDRDADGGERPLTILRDLDSERDTGVQIVSVEAWEIEDGAVAIVGELETISGRKLDDYRELQFVVYDAADMILGRGYTNFSPFGRRQTFDEEVCELRPGGGPVKVRVFPSGR